MLPNPSAAAAIPEEFLVGFKYGEGKVKIKTTTAMHLAAEAATHRY